jgi:signal transduction histidine kinase
MNWFNSFRVQLIGTTLILVILLAVAVALGLQTAVNAADYQPIINLIGQQRTNALLIDATLDRLEEPDSETDRVNLAQLVISLAANFDQAQAALRLGDDALDIRPLRNPTAISMLDELDDRWQEYRLTALSSVELDADQIAELDATIDRQGVAVYTFADRLAQAVNTLALHEIEESRQRILGIIAFSLFFLIVAFVIMNNLVRSVNRLASAAERMGRGDLKTRVKLGHINEIARVGQVFNAMAEQIEQRIVEAQTARERAERSDKVKSTFLANMSHELRTPLNAVINFTKFVAKGDLGPVNDEQAETLYEVVDSARHLLNLINDVLDMSKIESGSLQLFVVNDVDIRAIIDQVVATGKSLVEGKSVDIQTQLDPELPRIRGDRQRLVQVLLNVISNACKFTEAGVITISAQKRANEVVIGVTDTGPGIAPEDQMAVFEAFKQTNLGLRQGGGTGLGMPITKSLVEAHGGQIKLDSQLGKGATFTIILPVTSDTLIPVFA